MSPKPETWEVRGTITQVYLGPEEGAWPGQFRIGRRFAHLAAEPHNQVRNGIPAVAAPGGLGVIPQHS